MRNQRGPSLARVVIALIAIAVLGWVAIEQLIIEPRPAPPRPLRSEMDVGGTLLSQDTVTPEEARSRAAQSQRAQGVSTNVVTEIPVMAPLYDALNAAGGLYRPRVPGISDQYKPGPEGGMKAMVLDLANAKRIPAGSPNAGAFDPDDATYQAVNDYLLTQLGEQQTVQQVLAQAAGLPKEEQGLHWADPIDDMLRIIKARKEQQQK